jgi:hypothetical protein
MCVCVCVYIYMYVCMYMTLTFVITGSVSLQSCEKICHLLQIDSEVNARNIRLQFSQNSIK